MKISLSAFLLTTFLVLFVSSAGDDEKAKGDETKNTDAAQGASEGSPPKAKALEDKLAASQADAQAKAQQIADLSRALATAKENAKADAQQIANLEKELAAAKKQADKYQAALKGLRDSLANLGRKMADGNTTVAARTGTGDHVYQAVTGWPKYPEGKSLGSLHGDVAADSQGKVYIAVGGTIQVIDANGAYEGDLGEKWGGVHGMKVRKQNGEEFLFVAQTGAKTISKLKLDGTVVWQIVGPPKVEGMYGSAKEYNPTDVDLAPDGTIYVVDGYGRSLVHIYDQAGKYRTTFGGKGTENGKFNVCHNIIVDTRQEKPSLLISDRQNNRLQLHAMDGTFVKTIDAELRQPCAADIYGDLLAVGELGGRLSLYDKNNKLLARLGDEPSDRKKGNGAPPESWVDGALVAVHGCTFDAKGDLYAQEWNRYGRIVKYTAAKE